MTKLTETQTGAAANTPCISASQSPTFSLAAP